jgi:Lamin Tail Domain
MGVLLMRSPFLFAYLLFAAGCSQILGGGDLDGFHGPDDSSGEDGGGPGTKPPGGDPGHLTSAEDAGVPDDDAGDEDDASTPQDSGRRDAGGDAQNPDSGGDSGGVDCPAPLATGDLVIVEVMVASMSGSGDIGEWVELQSTRSCRLNLRGLHVESPRGTASPDTLDFTQDTFVPPLGTVIVADSLDPSKNHNLPGQVFAWAATPSDVLKNGGDTVTLTAGGVTIDTLTYAVSDPWTYGVSMSFASNCAASLRTNLGKWAGSKGSWATGLYGTPNAANSDITCPP